MDENTKELRSWRKVCDTNSTEARIAEEENWKRHQRPSHGNAEIV